MDPEFRTESRRRWAVQAPGWSRRAQQLADTTMPVTTWMVERIRPQPGHAVLELAAGTGDVGFMAAELISPGGLLICSDFSPQMLSAAQQRAKALSVPNVRFRQIDAETMDLPAASLDGVLCRWGFMLMADPEAALRQVRRVLKPGGRLALAAWTAAGENPWSSLPQREMRARGLMEEADPATPHQYAWAQEGRVADALQDAGFVDFETGVVAFGMRYESFEAWWQTQQDLSSGFARAVRDAGPRAEEVRSALREATAEHAREDGSLELPARTWVAAAVA